MIETNASAISALGAVEKKMGVMSRAKLSNFQLDDRLGGDSIVLNQNSVKRLYGEKAPDIIQGLKRQPAIAVPVVLKRMKFKQKEWRKCQGAFNSVWRNDMEQVLSDISSSIPSLSKTSF